MKSLLVVGAGGHGKVVKEIAKSLGYEKIAFVDDYSSDAIGKIDDVDSFVCEYKEAFCGIGNNELRKMIVKKLVLAGFEIPALVHNSAYISLSAQIENGVVIEPKAIVNANSTKKGSIISVGAIVDHDVEIKSYAHVNAGAIVKAGAIVDECGKLEAGEVVLGYPMARVSK